MEAFDFDDWEVLDIGDTPMKDLPQEMTVEEASAVILPSVTPVVPSDPRELTLQELNAKVEALRTKVTGFDNEVINPVAAELTKINQEQNDAKRIFQQLVDELNKQYSERQTELYKARNERRYLQDELDRMQREHSNLLKSMQTEKILSEIETKIDYLIADAPWGIHARDYQLTGLKYMIAAFETNKSGVLLADDTGLGKTLQSIMLDYCLQSLFPVKYDRMPLVLWITSPSLIKQTVREIKNWSPNRKVVPIEGSWNKNAREWAATMAIDELALTVVNYEQMNTNDVIRNTEWDVIFVDECTRLKGGANPSKPTKVWSNLQALLWEVETDSRGKVSYKNQYDPTPKCKFFVPLSGTPIVNKPSDVWAYLHLFAPTKFPKLKNFEREFCYGWPEVRVNFERLINTMSGQVIRRSKKDVLTELPDKIREPHDVDMTPNQRKMYDEMKNNFFMYLDSNKEQSIQATVVIEWLIRLWEIALFPGIMNGFDEEMNEIPLECQESGVLDEAMDIIEQTLAAGEKIVVWSAWFKAPLYEMKERIEREFKVKAAVYTGDQSTTLRDEAVVSFQSEEEGSVQVLCASMKTAGMGLNLQNASTAIMLDKWWSYATMLQAEDRMHRMGQKDTVVIHELSANDSVYQFVNSKVMAKEEMAEDIMSSKKFKKGGNWREELEGLI